MPELLHCYPSAQAAAHPQICLSQTRHGHLRQGSPQTGTWTRSPVPTLGTLVPGWLGGDLRVVF